MDELDLSILKYYRQGKELCGLEGVHDNLYKNGYLNGDLELTEKGFDFMKTYSDWDKIIPFDNKRHRINITKVENTAKDNNYNLAYLKASDFMNNADEKLQNIINKLNDDEWETLRDRFADFYVLIILNK